MVLSDFSNSHGFIYRIFFFFKLLVYIEFQTGPDLAAKLKLVDLFQKIQTNSSGIILYVALISQGHVQYPTKVANFSF